MKLLFYINKILKIFTIIFLVILMFLVLFLYFFTRNDIKIISKEKIGIFSVILYEIDPGARGSKTINVTIGIKPNLNERGNIFSAVFPESSYTTINVDEEKKIVYIYLNESRYTIIRQMTSYKKITIKYETFQ